MTTQLLARYDIADAAKWQTAFDADAEDRGNNGLTVLQVWREGAGRRWVLYQVSNPGAAKWLDASAPVFNPQAGVTASEFHLVETV